MTTQDERRALHALLFEHPEGMTIADLAVELGLTEEAAQALLEGQERSQLVRSDVDERVGVLRYVTLRATAPLVDAHAALRELEASRRRAMADERRRRLWAQVLVVGTVVLGLVGLVATAAHRAASSSRAPTEPDHASARESAARRRVWKGELDDLEARTHRLDDDALSAGCDHAWRAGDRCYVSHRLLTRAAFDDERARMVLRAAQLRRLLEESL